MANNAAKKKTTTKKNTATKKSSSSGKKTASAKKTTSSASAPRKTTRGGSHSDRAKNAQSNNRVIAGIVCLLLALISALGYFHIEAILVEWIRTLIGGLTGWGFYLFPPCLFMVAYLLMHYRNTPLTGRIVALLLIPVLFGAMAQLLFSMTDLGAAGGLASIISILFNDGRQLAYGGVISGLLAYGLEKIISIYGAFPVLLLAFIYFVLRSFNITISQIMEWANSKEQPVSIREKIENKRYDQFDDDEGDFLPDEETHSQANPKIIQMPHLGKGNIDIPLDDEDDDLFDYDDVESVEEPFSIPKKRRVSNPANRRPEPVSQAAKAAPSRPAASTENVKPMSVQEAEELAGVSGTEPAKTREQKPRMSREEMANETAAVAAQIEKQEQAAAEYKFPPVDLLRPSPAAIGNGREEISMTKSRLEDTIQSFGISATISDVTRGPTVTRYDFELEQGIKLSKITNLSDDIALALGVSSVRIAPIPNRISTVGIEVPNRQNSAVYLRDIIDTPKFRNAKSTLTVALGKDIGGEGILGNISKLPHLLIAGTTGSGKSVCMNSLIISLLYKSRPEELKLIMIDPKMVELGIYNGIPQLYIPVVTDPKKAAGALQWAVVEMLKRYRLFSEQGVRDLDSYNEHKKASGEDILPRVVIVIDELADLMMAASKDVEESICRVAQMGRAAGMHLIIATQRPSADVITGLMKANIPSRIAFAVSSGLESRIILDQQGAEKLVGNGDMLFSPIGTRKPVRIQGAFVSDEEREEVINFIKQEGTAEYSDEIMATINLVMPEPPVSSIRWKNWGS